jgi:serine protease Do
MGHQARAGRPLVEIYNYFVTNDSEGNDMIADTIIREKADLVDTFPFLPESMSSAIVELVERAAPSIVEVRSHGRGGGAGVIWRSDGGVLTNYHVVAGRGRGDNLEVVLADGRTFAAKVASHNRTLDLALLEVDAQDLPAALVGDSSRLRVGELVFAVGHPWGQRGSVTMGIVSGLGTVTVPGSGRTAQYIRSDVHLAPGNSGGPMLNAQGAVIGINAMIFGGDMGIAIPSHVASSWVAGPPSRKVFLGVGVQPVQLQVALPEWGKEGRTDGLLVVAVEPESPAERAGLLIGDVMLAVAGQPVPDGDALADMLSQGAAQERVRLHMMRGGSIQQLEVELGAAESDA